MRAPADPAGSAGQLLLARSGYLFLILFAAGILLAGLLPPPSANQSAAHAVAMYTHHLTRVRLGLSIMAVGGGLYATWSCAISLQLRRMEGRAAPFANAEMVCGAVNTVVILLPAFILIAAAFAATEDPPVTRILTDFGMVMFIIAVGPTALSSLIIGTAIRRGQGPEVYPRWVGPFNLLCTPLFLVGAAGAFFRTGALAWQGIFGFWLAAVVFFPWFLVMTVTTERAIKRQRAEAVGAPLDD